MDEDTALVTRALEVLEAASFGQLSPASAHAYVAVAGRLEAEWRAAGPSWAGPVEGIANPRTASVRRSAWTRRAHGEVAAAVTDLRDQACPAADAMARLEAWVPECEAFPPAPPRDCSGLARGRPSARVACAPSKRAGLRGLPADWLGRLWREAVDRRYAHLDALAVVIATGCRPSEACAGVGVRRSGAALQVVVRGMKVRADAGQPWRLLSVADDADGPVARLLALADAAKGGKAAVRPACTPNALSMGIADLAAACLPGRRLSAYDVRHQRASDARAAFDGDLERLAAWLGHVGVATLRYYGHLPRSGGSRGPTPLAASAARPVMRRAPRPAPEAQTKP